MVRKESMAPGTQLSAKERDQKEKLELWSSLMMMLVLERLGSQVTL